jgi:TRAP-type C4-dicarboxylate transport system permease large subunit
MLLPSVAALGIDPLYFGVVTPPYGLLLFVLAALALMAAFSGIVMWLPRVLG